MKFKIDEVMKDKGFNNVKLAEAIGITKATMTNNLKKPTLDTLEKVAKAMGVKVSDLLDEGESDFYPIYKKDDTGNYKQIGFLNKKL